MNSERDDARELLAFYLDAGVDAVVGEAPIDRFADVAPVAPISPPRETESPDDGAVEVGAEGEAPRTDRAADRAARAARSGASLSAAGATTAPSALAAPPSPEAAIMAAREAAKAAQNLDELRALLGAFEGCMLRSTATQLVFADGNPQGRVMFVGEAPGRDEDIAGLPFVGRSGKLLDLMLAAIGLDRTQVYIANVVPWRPPGNRTPTPQETAICLPFIRRQIELSGAEILVCLGQPSTQTLLETREGITRTRGRWFKFEADSRELRALATYHPAFLLRSPLQKRLAWRDFLALKQALAS
jgi:uracil-DNA glycosylase